MSYVTSIMLIVSNVDGGDDRGDGPAIAEIQTWLRTHRDGEQLKDTSDQAGGFKCVQFEAHAAGLNGFDGDVPEFVRLVLSRDWACPENVVLILQPEEGRSVVYRPGDSESGDQYNGPLGGF